MTKYVPAIAAKIALGLGVVLYIISQFVLKPIFGSNAIEAAKTNGIKDEAALDAIEAAAYPHFLHVMAILFVLNVIIMLVIGKLRPRESEFVLPYTKEVDITPYRFVKPVGLAIVIVVILSYVYFS
jgi:SSS family solute:Na+ symporter